MKAAAIFLMLIVQATVLAVNLLDKISITSDDLYFSNHTIPVTVTYMPPGDTLLVISRTTTLPEYLSVKLITPTGKTVFIQYNLPTDMGSIGPPTPIKPNETIIIKKDTAMMFTLFLDEMYSFKEQGEYTLMIGFNLSGKWTPLAQKKITIINPKTFSELQQDNYAVRSEFADQINLNKWELSLYEKTSNRTALCSTTVRPNTKLNKALTDLYDYMWVSVESEGESSLFVFDIHNKKIINLIPWSKEVINLNTVVIQNLGKKIVVAGVESGTQYSSYYVKNQFNSCILNHLVFNTGVE